MPDQLLNGFRPDLTFREWPGKLPQNVVAELNDLELHPPNIAQSDGTRQSNQKADAA